ncbi:MAG TPA: M3 family oligoendopeptidase [Gemmatimonadales bacterium]|nr:M3 family oligoendopeptidase [Gemmatimonadales bacterium]
MLSEPLPADSAALASATWEQIARWYDELAAVPLDGANLESWLATWSRLDELVTEAASLAMIAYTCDTGDQSKEAAHLRFSTEILPQLESKEVALARRLVDAAPDRADLDTVVRRFRTAIEIFREANVPLVAEAERLAARYQQVTGGMTAEWGGERVPLPRLSPFLKSRDRGVREAAWRASVEPYVSARDDLAAVFDRMVELRSSIATNAGFADYRDYIFAAKCRFDYTPADTERLHDAIEQAVVPAVERAMAVRRDELGLSMLRPWDTAVDPWRDAAPVPYRSVDELQESAARIFTAIDPDLGGQFRLMINEGLLDLESREGKAPGGYCDTLHAQGRPFVFMNASGIAEDVTTLLHEAGHCFHAFASHSRPFIWQRHPGAESAELASMSMELLAAPHLAQPVGFYPEEDALSARLEHLEHLLLSLAHIASVDAFQSWVYTAPMGRDAAARDAQWLRVRERFEPGVDWSNLTAERVARWYRQLHIFLYPFYYIEYGIAQIGALQVWRNARRDPARAIAEYRRFLALGATVPLPDLYRAAGVNLSFDADLLADLVEMVEEEMETIRGALVRAA